MPCSRSAVVTLIAALCALGSPSWAQEAEIEIEIEDTPAEPAAPPPAEAPAEPTPVEPAPVEPAPVEPVTAPPAEVVPPAPPNAPDDAALRDTIARLEARLAALEGAQPEPVTLPDPEAPTAPPAAGEIAAGDPRPRWQQTVDAARRRWWDKLDLRISGYVQAQYEHHELSEDEISPDGAALNQDRFLVRRGRLRVDRFFKYAHVALEIDANTVRGPFVSVRRAEASFFLPNKVAGLPPYVMVTAGLSEIPFGFELRQGPRNRVFAERTAGSLAFFRGEPDVGLRVSGGVGPLRYAFAVQNGVPLDDRPNAVTTVFNHQKTGVGRLGFELRKPERYELSGGVSFLAGTGFHAGQTETKSTLLWRDVNQDGNVTLNELVAMQGQAATPSATFPRWGLNADLQLGFYSPIGWTRAYGEVTVATNLDRSYYVADPIATGYNLRELSWYGALLQDITPFAFVGFRGEAYDPNADLFEARRGLFIPAESTEFTLTPVAGLQLPRRGRLLFQYDHVIDHLGRDVRGEPVDLPNDRWTLRLQVEI